jgi:hypothetical protein
MRLHSSIARAAIAMLAAALCVTATRTHADPVCDDPVPDCTSLVTYPGGPDVSCTPTNAVFTFTWTTPGDPINPELKVRYPVRTWTLKRSTSLINASNWAAATTIRTRAALAPEEEDTCTFVGAKAVFYYFAYRSVGYSGQESDVCDFGSGSCPGFGGSGGLIAVGSGVELQSIGPAPIRSACRLRFSLPASSDPGSARLGVFDVAGRQVRSLSLAGLPQGRNTVEWDLRSDAGARVHGGIYFVRLVLPGAERSVAIHVAP